MDSEPNILIINGSIGGRAGNTEVLLERAAEHLSRTASVTRLDLSEEIPLPAVEAALLQASGFVIGTGTYWDSWGSPLQRFFEAATSTEGTELWLGKPAAVIVTMHSVGGKAVLSRLQGVLNTFGAVIPPMSGVVYSAVNQLALQRTESPINDDLYRPEDVEVACHNLLEVCRGSGNWRTWCINRTGFEARWASDSGDVSGMRNLPWPVSDEADVSSPAAG